MLSSQPRSSKIFFSLYCFLKGKKYFAGPYPKTANASQIGVRSTMFFYAVFLRSVNSKACGSMAGNSTPH